MNTVCPVHSDKAPDEVSWAGLPVNLDLAFSRKQRDRVYVQHLMRKREAQLWKRLPSGAQACTCGIAAEADQTYVESLSAKMR
jgi:sulfite reductase alpha subunit-like flavoprotein